MGGTGVLSFPNSAFDMETFTTFVDSLEKHFGFTVAGPTGKSRAIDIKPPKEIGWVITVRKTGNVDLTNLDVNELSMLYDQDFTISKRGRGKKAPASKGQDYTRDDALYSPHDFEVYNPATGETIGASSLEVIIKKEIEESKPILTLSQIKENLLTATTTQRSLWIETRRSIEGALGVNYERAEEVLYDILSERDLGDPSEWEEININKIRRILSTEVRKLDGYLTFSK
jgi:hypothetical protein